MKLDNTSTKENLFSRKQVKFNTHCLLFTTTRAIPFGAKYNFTFDSIQFSLLLSSAKLQEVKYKGIQSKEKRKKERNTKLTYGFVRNFFCQTGSLGNKTAASSFPSDILYSFGLDRVMSNESINLKTSFIS